MALRGVWRPQPEEANTPHTKFTTSLPAAPQPFNSFRGIFMGLQLREA
jgi:hypothetical protein